MLEQTTDWNEIRDGLILMVEELLISHTTPFGLRVTCPKCQWETMHDIGRLDVVARVTDFIIEQMNAYQFKLTKELISTSDLLELHHSKLTASKRAVSKDISRLLDKMKKPDIKKE